MIVIKFEKQENTTTMITMAIKGFNFSFWKEFSINIPDFIISFLFKNLGFNIYMKYFIVSMKIASL